MKILLACRQDDTPALLAANLAARFNGESIDIDVLTVIPGKEEIPPEDTEHTHSVVSISESCEAYRSACAYVATLARDLNAAGFNSVRTHVEYGEPAETILNSSRLWRAGLLVIGAPRRRGLFAALRLDSVTRRLLRWSDCPVEVLRHDKASTRQHSMLLPFPVEAAGHLPLQRLLDLPWQGASHLHLLGVLPPGLDDCQTEASPAAVLLALQDARDARQRAETVMEQLVARIRESRPDGPELTYELQEGELRDVTVRCVKRTNPSQLLLGNYFFDKACASLYRSLNPAALALSVPCSVMLLQDHDVLPAPRPDRGMAPVFKLVR